MPSIYVPADYLAAKTWLLWSTTSGALAKNAAASNVISFSILTPYFCEDSPAEASQISISVAEWQTNDRHVLVSPTMGTSAHKQQSAIGK